MEASPPNNPAAAAPTAPPPPPPPPSAGMPAPSAPLPTPKLEEPKTGFDAGAFIMTLLVVTALFTAGTFGYRYLFLGRAISQEQQRVAQMESQLSSPELSELATKVESISAGLDKLRIILDDQTKYAELFWLLRRYTEKSIRWSSMSYLSTQDLTLVGEAGSWGDVARQLAAFKSLDKLSEVELSTATLSTSGANARINFSITAKVNVSKLTPPQ